MLPDFNMGENWTGSWRGIRALFTSGHALYFGNCECQDGYFGIWYVYLRPYSESYFLILCSADEEEGANNDRDGWETVMVDGKTMGIKTCALEEKCQAFETLLIYCSTLGAKYAPYLSQTLEICIPCLKFSFHEGVREASAM